MAELSWRASTERAARALPRLHGGPLRLLSLLVGLLLWETYVRFFDDFGLPSVTEIAEAWLVLVRDGSLVEAIAVSVQALVIGLLLAIVLGLGLGLLMAKSQSVEVVLRSYINALMALPSVAYIPLVIIWLGTGLQARIAIVFEYAFFVIVINTLAGIRSVDGSLLEMGRSFVLTRPRMTQRVILPGAAPGIAAGIRLGLSRGIKGTVNAEMLIALTGLGGLIIYYGSSFRTEYLLAVIATVVVLALLANAVLDRTFRRFGPPQAVGD